MKKFVLFILCLSFFAVTGGCKRETPSLHEKTPAPTKEIIERSPLTIEFTDKEDFFERVRIEHSDYVKTQSLSDYQLAKIQYYLDFTTLPENAQFKQITVPGFLYYISVEYELEGKPIVLTWYRADYGDTYDHYESSKAATSGLPQNTIRRGELAILEVYHEQTFQHYSYHWEQDGDYINMIVAAELVEKYQAEAFLSVDKVFIEFGDASPAIVTTPKPIPASPTPSPIPGLATMPPPDSNSDSNTSTNDGMNTYGPDPSTWCGPDPDSMGCLEERLVLFVKINLKKLSEK